MAESIDERSKSLRAAGETVEIETVNFTFGRLITRLKRSVNESGHHEGARNENGFGSLNRR